MINEEIHTLLLGLWSTIKQKHTLPHHFQWTRSSDWVYLKLARWNSFLSNKLTLICVLALGYLRLQRHLYKQTGTDNLWVQCFYMNLHDLSAGHVMQGNNTIITKMCFLLKMLPLCVSILEVSGYRYFSIIISP